MPSTSRWRAGAGLACLVLLGAFPAHGAGELRASENVHWRVAREFQQKLSLAAEACGVTPSLQILVEWDALEVEERRLLDLARQLDAEQARLEARDAGLGRERPPLEDTRVRLDREASELTTEREECVTIDAGLASDVEAMNSERARLAAALAAAKDPSSLSEQIGSFNLRHAALQSRLDAYTTCANTWNASREDWQRRQQEHEQRRLDFNRRLAEFLAEWDAFRARDQAEYGQVVESWELRLMAFGQLQALEARRIADAARIQSPQAATPDLSPPQPRIEGGGQADALLSKRTLAEASVDALSLAGKLMANPATKAMGFSPWGTAAIVGSKAAYDGLKGAERAEERHLRADLDRLRQLPGVIRNLDTLARGLEEDVQAGRRTREEKRRLLGERARALVARLPGSGPDDGDRLAANIFSPEAGYAILTSVGSWALGKAAGTALAPPAGAAVPRAFTRLLGGSDAQGVAATKAFFELGVKKTARKTVDVLREVRETAEQGAPQLLQPASPSPAP